MAKPLALEYAGSVIRNYRDAYIKKHGHCELTDLQMLSVINSCDVAGTGEEQDEWMQDDLESAHLAFYNHV